MSGDGDTRVAKPGAARRRLDRLVAGLARLVLHLFFRRVEVVGRERLPAGRPLLIVANHFNGLVDPLLILGTLPVVPRFLAKHTLWRIPFVAPFLALAGAVPVYRRKEAGGDPTRNVETFARCEELLAAGGSIALFPEGTSHSEPALAPLRTGAARIVLEAEARFPGIGVRVVPIGLTFESKQTFRSRALVEVGEPIDPAPEIARYAADPAGAVRALTARIDAGLKQVTLNYGSWQEARLIGRAADLFAHSARRPPPVQGAGRLVASFSLHRAFIEGYGELTRRFPERTATAAAAVQRYDRLLTAARLRDEQVAADYPLPPVTRFLARTLLRLLVHLPFAAVGIALNWPTYRLVGAIAGRTSGEPDMPATYKLFGGMVLFPLTWCAEALLAGWLARRHGGATEGEAAAVALAVVLLAAATAYAALRFDEERARLVREARAYLLLHARGALAADLKARRAEAAREVETLAELAGRDAPAAPGGAVPLSAEGRAGTAGPPRA